MLEMYCKVSLLSFCQYDNGLNHLNIDVNLLLYTDGFFSLFWPIMINGTNILINIYTYGIKSHANNEVNIER